jgi:hypothetical protein
MEFSARSRAQISLPAVDRGVHAAVAWQRWRALQMGHPDWERFDRSKFDVSIERSQKQN